MVVIDIWNAVEVKVQEYVNRRGRRRGRMVGIIVVDKTGHELFLHVYGDLRPPPIERVTVTV